MTKVTLGIQIVWLICVPAFAREQLIYSRRQIKDSWFFIAQSVTSTWDVRFAGMQITHVVVTEGHLHCQYIEYWPNVTLHESITNVSKYHWKI